jgi:hypothetical protein
MIPDPSTIRLIHLHMIQDELERQGLLRQHRDEEPPFARGPAAATRRVAARALHALARQIDPVSHPRSAAPVTNTGTPDGIPT